MSGGQLINIGTKYTSAENNQLHIFSEALKNGSRKRCKAYRMKNAALLTGNSVKVLEQFGCKSAQIDIFL